MNRLQLNAKDDYNHVLNNLQDYMLSGKLLARINYQTHETLQESAKSEKSLSVSEEKKVKEKEKERFFYPKEKDQLFWCYFIIKNGIDKYEYPNATSFVNEKTEKFKCIDILRNNKQQLKVKKIKNVKEDVEDDLANRQCIGMKTFIALCIAQNINIMYIHKRKCFEIVFDEDAETHVVHCINNNSSNATDFKYCYEPVVSQEQLNKYRTEYFSWESVEKPLKAISAYKLEDLVELSKKMGLDEEAFCKIKRTKKDYYEWLIMNL
jgi:hypothetical protein